MQHIGISKTRTDAASSPFDASRCLPCRQGIDALLSRSTHLRLLPAAEKPGPYDRIGGAIRCLRLERSGKQRLGNVVYPRQRKTGAGGAEGGGSAANGFEPPAKAKP